VVLGTHHVESHVNILLAQVIFV